MAPDRPSGLTFEYDPAVAGGPFVPGEVLGERYRYERALSEGGMAVVVAAQHVELGERVAMKFIKPAFLSNPDLVARFAREAKTTARLRSEHTVKVLDVGVDRRRGPFLVMEYLEGRDLKAAIEREGPLEGERVAEIAIQACDALAAAHAQGVVHRDVKPDNVFLLQRGGFEAVRVLDFGISKATLTGSLWSADVSLVRTALLLGSPVYMSPEQMRSSASVDHRSDIWSLGVTLYEALCGEPPFAAASITEMCALVLESEPRHLAERNPRVERGLAEVVMSCLRKGADERPQNVAELALALLPYAPPRARLSVERIVALLSPPAGAPAALTTLPAPRSSWRPAVTSPRGSGRHGPLAETMAETPTEASGGAAAEASGEAASAPGLGGPAPGEVERVLGRRRRLGLALACAGGVSLVCSSAMTLFGGAGTTRASIEAARPAAGPAPVAAFELPSESPAAAAARASAPPSAPLPPRARTKPSRHRDGQGWGGAAALPTSSVRADEAGAGGGRRAVEVLDDRPRARVLTD